MAITLRTPDFESMSEAEKGALDERIADALDYLFRICQDENEKPSSDALTTGTDGTHHSDF